MSSFTIRSGSTSDHLTFHITSTRHRTDNPYEDWLDVEVEIRAGGFTGKYPAQFPYNDITQLHDELQNLYENLSGSLTFQTLEGQIEFEITGDGRGHFKIQCIALDSWGSENRLYFSLNDFDQTFIPQMLRDLADIRKQADI